MLLVQNNHPVSNPATTANPGHSAAARMFAQGTLGARLLERARLAAAIHMAQSAAPRNDGAQFLPRMEAPR